MAGCPLLLQGRGAHNRRVQGIPPGAGGSQAKGSTILILFPSAGMSYSDCPQEPISVEVGPSSQGQEGALSKTVQWPGRGGGLCPQVCGEPPFSTRRVREDETFGGHPGLCPGGTPGISVGPEPAPTLLSREDPPTQVISPFPVRPSFAASLPQEPGGKVRHEYFLTYSSDCFKASPHGHLDWPSHQRGGGVLEGRPTGPGVSGLQEKGTALPTPTSPPPPLQGRH